MARHSLQLGSHQVRLPIMVIHTVDHGILKGDTAARFLKILMTGGKQILHGIGTIDRHNFRSRLAVRRMEGYGQGQLGLQLRQTLDAGDHAAGGQ